MFGIIDVWHGFNFGIPNQNIKREDIFAEFELLYAQLSTHQAVSNEADQALRARLSDLAHAYCGIPNDVRFSHATGCCLGNTRIEEECCHSHLQTG